MFVMKCWKQCAAKPQQETGESQERLTWVSLTMEILCLACLAWLLVSFKSESARERGN